MTKKELKIVRKGVQAVRYLMDESHGVDGLHRNGDVAPWGELEATGCFASWLWDFNKLEEHLNSKYGIEM